MKRREFLQATAALGAGALPVDALAQSAADRRKDTLPAVNEPGPNVLDIHTVGANRPSYCEIRPACAWS